MFRQTFVAILLLSAASGQFLGTKPKPTGSLPPKPTGSLPPKSTGSLPPKPTGPTSRPSLPANGPSLPASGPSLPASRPSLPAARPSAVSVTKRPTPKPPRLLQKPSGKFKTLGAIKVVGNVMQFKSQGVQSKLQKNGSMSFSKDGKTNVDFWIFDMVERDSSGAAVTTLGHAIPHSTFKSMTANFSSPVYTTVGVLKSDPTKGIDVQLVNMTFSLPNVGKLIFEVNTFDEAGTVTLGTSEEFQVVKGDVKFSVYVLNWNFCTAGASSCTQTGAYLDVTVGLQAPDPKTTTRPASQQRQQSKGTGELSLGGGCDMIISKQVMINSTWQAAPSGYPAIASTASKDKKHFIIRFPSFSGAAFYDPAVHITGSGGVSNTPMMSLTTVLLGVLAMVVLF